MGILRATGDAIKGGFGDAWLETIEPDNMGLCSLKFLLSHLKKSSLTNLY